MKPSDSPAPSSSGITRAAFLRLGLTGAAALNTINLQAAASVDPQPKGESDFEYLTPEEKFRSFGRGKPPPYKLPAEKRRAVGLARETWQLEVLAEPGSNSKLERPYSRELGTALDWERLMTLAEKHAVRFLSVMTCTNMPGPCGMGLWEGVPLREVIWQTRPSPNVRRVFYYGYHNDDPAQRFQSSLTINRVLEDPPGELPVILCYKLNDQWLTPKRGGPVRMIVPGLYGNKSVKWLQRIVLTNRSELNDTYSGWNNDTESALKTCASFLRTPKQVEAGQPVDITGVAQVGMSGLGKVQYWLQPQDQSWPEDDPYFTQADWQDAQVFPPPTHWGGGLKEGKLPSVPLQFDEKTGQPREWPLRHTVVYWKAHLRGVPAGSYHLRCRTIDAQGYAQPMPRPFLKSGHNAIRKKTLTVT